ncbi:bifunctional (p)ppGpp synthetase/guanosine-3',5'-bis(diphosphate) 3'-pyrophosphohydrolase [bacterium]|nr:bifunctional (p)ppGpp synthetase/guanosine-3',5'-bis(diphosphate) 3'-pyrophosphohydrolase [bacterium]
MNSPLFPLSPGKHPEEAAIRRDFSHWLKDLAKTYKGDVDREFVRDAFTLALIAHRGQLREGGTLYITHPVAVAKILTKDGYPGNCAVAAALLHDVVEDTSVRAMDVVAWFGPETTDLVLGLTKLTSLPAEARDLRTENLRKIFLVTFSDIRILMLKLADRLHNLQTLTAKKSREKADRIAKESELFFSPLAARFGLFRLKLALDDAVFSYFHPKEARDIRHRIESISADRDKALKKLTKGLRTRISDRLKGLKFRMTFRVKNIQSTWRKMEMDGLPFEEIRDLYAMRISVPTEEDCYRVLGLVHQLHPPIHGFFHDYIADPKSNGYQSLHTVIAPTGTPSLEVQIRTYEMDRIAQWGGAAHWVYKGASLPPSFQKEMSRLNRFRSRFGWGELRGQPRDLVEELQQDFFKERLFVYTPQGDKVELPRGASALDFAFAIHSQLGARTLGALVNGRPVPLNHPLSLGDEVEIESGHEIVIEPAWSEWLTTTQGKREVQAHLKAVDRTLAESSGKNAFLKVSSSEGVHHLPLLSGPSFRSFCRSTGIKSDQDLFWRIGTGQIRVDWAVHRLTMLYEVGQEGTAQVEETDYPGEFHLPKGMEGDAQSGSCCHPLPGDVLVAVREEKGLVVHRTACRNAKGEPKSSQARWGSDCRPLYQTEIHITLVNRKGALLNAVKSLSEGGVNILDHEVKIQEIKKDVGFARYTIEVRDLDHLRQTLARLDKVEGVVKARRALPRPL